MFKCINNKIINNDINNDHDDAEALKTFLHIRAGVDGVGRAIATVVVVLFAGPPHVYLKEVDGVQHHGCDGESYSRQLSDHTGHHLDTHNKNFTHLDIHNLNFTHLDIHNFTHLDIHNLNFTHLDIHNFTHLDIHN